MEDGTTGTTIDMDGATAAQKALADILTPASEEEELAVMAGIFRTLNPKARLVVSGFLQGLVADSALHAERAG